MEKKLTKGQQIDLQEKQIRGLEAQTAGLQGFCQHLNNGLQVLMQSLDGQKMMSNALVDCVRSVLVEKELVTQEAFDSKLESHFQEHLTKYKTELQHFLDQQAQQMADAGVVSEPVDSESEADPVDLSKLLALEVSASE